MTLRFEPLQTFLCQTAENAVDNDIAFFLRDQWFSRFEKMIPNSDTKGQLLVSDDAELESIKLPVYQNRLGKLGLKTLSSMSNYYSPIYGPIGGHIDDEAKANLYVKSGQERFSQFDRIDFLPLYQEHALIWLKAFENIGFKGFMYQHSTNWIHENIVDSQQYWALRPSRLRNTLKRKREKLLKDSSFSIKLVDAIEVKDLNSVLADYHNVYFDSWKKIEPYPGFIDSIARYASQKNELRVGFIYHDGLPVAAQIWFVANQVAYIFKLAHRKRYTDQSVGTILTAAMFEHVIEHDNVTSIDFLTGDDNYKKDWMEMSRPLYGIQLCNRHSLKGKACIILNQLSGLKKMIKNK